MTTDDIIDAILKREGSTYTNDPIDRGGPTKFGITLRTLAEYHHDDSCTADEVENLTEAEARAIYRELYIDRPGFMLLTGDALRAFLVDFAVNSGARAAVKHLQRRLMIKDDGILGPYTAQKANAANQAVLLAALIGDREQFYRDIVSAKPDQARFLTGWLNRNNSFKVA